MNPTQNIDTSSRLDTLENNINKEQTVNELFDAEQKLLDSITNPTLKEQAQEEFNEMISEYNNNKESVSTDTVLSLDELKQEFRNDIKGIQSFNGDAFGKLKEEFPDLQNKFFEVLSEMDNKIEEKALSVLSLLSEDSMFEVFEGLLYDIEEVNELSEESIEEFLINEGLVLALEETKSNFPTDKKEFDDFLSKSTQEQLINYKNKLEILNYELGANDGEIEKIYNKIKENIVEGIVKSGEKKIESGEKKIESGEKKIESFKSLILSLKTSDKIIIDELDEISKTEDEIKILNSQKIGKKQIEITILDQKISKLEKESIGKSAKIIANHIENNPSLLDKFSPEQRNSFIDKLVLVTKYIEGYDTTKLEALKVKIEEKPDEIKFLSHTTSVKAKNGAYELDIDFDMEKINNPKKLMSYSERAEFAKKKLELRGEIKTLGKEVKEFGTKLKNLDKKEEEIKKEIEDCKKWPTVENEEKIKELEYKLGEIKVFKENYKQKLDSRKAMLEAKQGQLNTLIKDFNDEIQRRLDIKLKELREKEIQTKDNLAFLERTGFTVFSNSTIDPAIKYINKFPGSLGLKGEIDLMKGEFGESGMDGQSKGREVFVRLFNKMISGNPDEPITDIMGVVKGTNNILKDREKSMEMLKKYDINPNTTGISHKLIENLKTQSNTNKEETIEDTESVKNKGTVKDDNNIETNNKSTQKALETTEKILKHYYKYQRDDLKAYYEDFEPVFRHLEKMLDEGKEEEVKQKLKEINYSMI